MAQGRATRVSNNLLAMKNLLRLMVWARPHLRLLLAAVALSLVGQATMVAVPKVIQHIVAEVLEQGRREHLGLWAAAILALSAARGVCFYGEAMLGSRFGQEVLRGIREALHAHLCRLSFDYFDRTRTGQLLSRITSDMELIGFFVTWGGRMIIRSVLLGQLK